MVSESQDFQSILAEAGIEFWPTPDFVICPVHENSVFRYQHAMRSPSGNLEMRYRIDALTRLETERKAANAGMEVLASASLDQMVSVNFMALVLNLSGGCHIKLLQPVIESCPPLPAQTSGAHDLEEALPQY